MEEDLNENELEERFYSMIHYADEAQSIVATNQKDDQIVHNTPQSTVRRYWRTSGDQSIHKVIPTIQPNMPFSPFTPENSKGKVEKRNPSPSQCADLSLFQSPVPQYLTKTIEIIENDGTPDIVELQSSDEDEVIEVKLPPKPTITIESSDEDEISEVSKINDMKYNNTNKISLDNKTTTNSSDTEVSPSPVPSIVSSVSDEFIRGDCIALNISSKRPNNQSFDFSLHGSDIMEQSTPTKRKKKKKNKVIVTSTPITSSPPSATPIVKEGEYFATPKSKAKNKRQKSKKYSVSEKSVPNADVYDSDSNQSTIDMDKNPRSYSVTDKSFPHVDVYESDSNQSEKTSPPEKKEREQDICISLHSNVNLESHHDMEEASKVPKRINTATDKCPPTIDLTETTLVNDVISENIVMANVIGFHESDNVKQVDTVNDESTKFGSTNVPAILYEDLDFDNLKGKEKVCRKRKYSLSTLRAEMEKFYNESWGGENFNHREIQKNMSRDKNLWIIDPKDRMPGLCRRKPICNYCNRPGHRDYTCRMKPPVCYMCGLTGHYETRCPRKICVNCGSPNHMYTTMCRNCSNWNNVKCAECGQIGHPSSHCPDLWRRYHNTITCNAPLEENRQIKKQFQMFCSGCARRGHLIHNCRQSLPFSGLPINSPYVSLYNPVFYSTNENNKQLENTQRNHQFGRFNTQESKMTAGIVSCRNDRNKRQSYSPVNNDSSLNKKRNTSITEEADARRNTKSPVSNVSGRKTPQIDKDKCEEPTKAANDVCKVINNDTEPAKATNDTSENPQSAIPFTSSNHDERGQIIQDNEVSDTSDVATLARIYITTNIMEKLKTIEGEEWLKKSTQSNNVTVQNTDFNLFISILGKVGDQEAFHSELREWIKSKENVNDLTFNNDSDQQGAINNANSAMSINIPRNRYNVLRKINKALDLLKEDLGEPKDIFKELNFLQNHHQQLLKQKEISPKQLSNNRDNINKMVKKLNMVLIGQAGLANGSKHLNQLRILQEKLTNFREKYVPPNMRREIGEHYHCIFTALPREDYQDLVRKYYMARPLTFKKKKNDKTVMLSPAGQVKKQFGKRSQNIRVENEESNRAEQVIGSKALHNKTKNKLLFYHTRLMRSKPHDNVLNKTRHQLINRLSSHISSLGQDNYMSSKSFKKMRKRIKITQEQVQLFLANV